MVTFSRLLGLGSKLNIFFHSHSGPLKATLPFASCRYGTTRRSPRIWPSGSLVLTLAFCMGGGFLADSVTNIFLTCVFQVRVGQLGCGGTARDGREDQDRSCDAEDWSQRCGTFQHEESDGAVCSSAL